MARPSAVSNDAVFFLREVCEAAVTSNDRELWLFGSTVTQASVAVQLIGFLPHLLVEYQPGIGSLEEWVETANDTLRSWESEPDCITDVELVQRTPVVGFSETAWTLMQVTYRNYASRWRLMRFFANEVIVNGTQQTLRVYHDDWSLESQFLHASHLKLQQWVRLGQCAARTGKRRTCCQLEYVLRWNLLSPAVGVELPPPLLLAAVQIRAHAECSTPQNPVAPVATNSEDCVLSIVVQFYWMSTVPEAEHRLEWNGNAEAAMLQNFNSTLQSYDPDCLLFVCDTLQPIHYLRDRGAALCRFLPGFCKGNTGTYWQCLGRSLVCLTDIFGRMMIKPPLDDTSLATASQHPTLLRHCPHQLHLHSHYNAAQCVDRLRQLHAECDVLVQIECGNHLVLEYLELSAASYTSLTWCVSRGQQIRVWNKLISKFHEQQLVVNREQLLQPPLCVPRPNADSSFPDPPALDNVPVLPVEKKPVVPSNRCVDLRGDRPAVAAPKKKKSKIQGGFVCEPAKGFYQNETFTFDFSSLYPSIIIGYNVCWMRLVFDQRVLHDDRLVKTYVPIDAGSCLVLVAQTADGQRARTVLPDTIAEVMRERIRIKAQMESATDSFVKSSLNAKQLSCKTFQNAVYGFLGVRKNPKLACGPLLATVCCIGRYMITTVAHFMKSHGGFIVYGDTDSVMVQFPCQLVDQTERWTQLYALCKRLSQEASRMFPAPNELTFESMKVPFHITKKKNYFALEYSGSNWRYAPKLSIKGLGLTKRDRCPFVRRVGHAVLQLLLHNRDQDVLPLLSKEVQLLVTRRVPVADLVVTCMMQQEDNYKSENLVQLETARKIAARTGSKIEAGRRLSYVMLEGSSKAYLRGEDPEVAARDNLPLDIAYYLHNQLEKSLAPLFMFHSSLGVAVKQMLSTAMSSSCGSLLMSACVVRRVVTPKRKP